MDWSKKKKLTAKDYQKKVARYHLMYEKFKVMSIDELQECWRSKKMSSTDRDAIIAATDYLIKSQVAEVAKEEGILQESVKITGEGEE